MDRWTRFRLRVRLLAMVDWLLGTHFVERVTRHWWQEIQSMQAELASLQACLEDLDTSRHVLLRRLCLGYLQLRQVRSPESWLHFDPRLPDEESAIDVFTRALVTPHRARWRITPITDYDDLYTYDLVPNWKALFQDAQQFPDSLPADLLDWLAQQRTAEVSTDE